MKQWQSAHQHGRPMNNKRPGETYTTGESSSDDIVELGPEGGVTLADELEREQDDVDVADKVALPRQYARKVVNNMLETDHVVRTSPSTGTGGDHDGVNLAEPFGTRLPATEGPIANDHGDTQGESDKHPVVACTLAEQAVGRDGSPEDGCGILAKSADIQKCEGRGCGDSRRYADWGR